MKASDLSPSPTRDDDADGGKHPATRSVCEWCLAKRWLNSRLPSMTADRIEAYVQRRARGVVPLQDAWTRATQRMVLLPLSPARLELLLEAATTPGALATLVAWLEDALVLPDGPESAAENLLMAVENSDFSLSAWLLALEHFHFWLRSKGRTCRWNQSLGYIECCAAGIRGRAHNGLPHAVQEYLETYGFTGDG